MVKNRQIMLLYTIKKLKGWRGARGAEGKKCRGCKIEEENANYIEKNYIAKNFTSQWQKNTTGSMVRGVSGENQGLGIKLNKEIRIDLKGGKEEDDGKKKRGIVNGRRCFRTIRQRGKKNYLLKYNKLNCIFPQKVVSTLKLIGKIDKKDEKEVEHNVN